MCINFKKIAKIVDNVKESKSFGFSDVPIFS